jgi:hypothetical protein
VISMSTNYTSKTYPKEMTKIDLDGIDVDVLCELGDIEGSLRNKARIARLEARLKKIEELLGVKL